MKLPRLPNKCSVLEAKYSAEQMHDYAEKCIKAYFDNCYKKIEDDLKDIPVLTEVYTTSETSKRSFIDNLRDALR